MDTLADSLLADGRREAVVADCADLIEAHVAKLKGLKGMALRTAFTMLRGGEANAVHNAVATLVPDFVHSFEPLYQAFAKSGKQAGKPGGKPGGKAAGKSSERGFSAFLQAHREEAVAAMLGVTDARFARSKNATLKTVYPKVRGTVESELDGVLPALADMLEKHLKD
jgi:hypothetical protein